MQSETHAAVLERPGRLSVEGGLSCFGGAGSVLPGRTSVVGGRVGNGAAGLGHFGSLSVGLVVFGVVAAPVIELPHTVIVSGHVGDVVAHTLFKLGSDGGFFVVPRGGVHLSSGHTGGDIAVFPEHRPVPDQLPGVFGVEAHDSFRFFSAWMGFEGLSRPGVGQDTWNGF